MTSRRRSSSCEPVLIAVELSGQPNPLHSLDKNSCTNSFEVSLNELGDNPILMRTDVMVAADMTKYGNPLDALTSSPVNRRHNLGDDGSHCLIASTSTSAPILSSSSMQRLSIGQKSTICTSSPNLLIPNMVSQGRKLREGESTKVVSK